MTNKKNPASSFRRGYNKAARRDFRAIRAELMNVFGWTTTQSFYQHMSGQIEPRMSEIPIIEGVFAKFGITDIWGEE